MYYSMLSSSLWNSDSLLRDRKGERLGYYGSKEIYSCCLPHLVRFSEDYSCQCRLRIFMQIPAYVTCLLICIPFSEYIPHSDNRFVPNQRIGHMVDFDGPNESLLPVFVIVV